MMGRVCTFGIVISTAVLGPVDAVEAGGARGVPPVRVIVPSSANGIELERDDLPAPELEVMKHPARLDAPAIPGFELPATQPGLHSARELRVRGKRMLGSELKVKGYVTWIYDCAQVLASANPGATPAQVAAVIRSDPALCERPMFALGDARDTSRDASILVVDVQAMPSLGVGDRAMVTGTWAIQRSHAESGDGVLVYKAFEPSPAVATGTISVRAGASNELEIELDVKTLPPLRRFVDDATLDASIGHLNACNKSIAARQYDAAIAECRSATEVWQDNHLAWYAWATAHMARREWGEARAVVEHAVKLRPDRAMYQLYHGISLYEAERQRVRDVQARNDHKQPEDAELDPSMLKLDPARDALATAIKLAPDLWRAHYYLGRVYRDLDEPRRAAEQFTATIKTHPGYRFGYIALSELYRGWDYVDQALVVATLGTTRVPAAEAPELWFEVGMAYDTKHADDKAIDAFGRAIAIQASDALSKLQRGQLYLRNGDYVNAARDLGDVIRSPDPRTVPAKQRITKLLAQIASRKDAPSSRDSRSDCTRSGNTIVCRTRPAAR